MQCYSQARSGVLKRKRRSSDCSDIENEPLKEDKRVRIEKNVISLGESSHGLLASEAPAGDERVPLTELSVANISTSCESVSDDSSRFSLGDVGDYDKSSLNNIMLDLEQITTSPGTKNMPSNYLSEEENESQSSSGSSYSNIITIPCPPSTYFQPRCIITGRSGGPLPLLDWSDEIVLWAFMSKKDAESMNLRNSNYFPLHPSIQTRMRSVLLEWLLEVCAVYKLQRETYFLAVDYLDRYLSLTTDVSKKQLQLIGVTCLHISSKFEEIYPPKLGEFAYITDGACVESDILKMELKIIKVLNWRSSVITPISWLTLLLQIIYHRKMAEKELEMQVALFPSQAFENASHLLDLCSLDDGYLQYSYKILGVSALYVSFSKLLTLDITGLTYEEISCCVGWMSAFWTVLQSESGLDISTQETPNNKRTSPWESICKHHVNLDMLESVQAILKKRYEEEEEDTCLLTPPLSCKKNTDC